MFGLTFAAVSGCMENLTEPIREKIKLAADALFLEEGVREVSIDDICRVLCISKKTFYRHYPQKEDLIEDVLSMRASRRDAEFCQQNRGKSTVELIVSTFDMLGKKKNYEKERRDMSDVRKYYPETFSKFMAHKAEAAREKFIEGCECGKASGVVREDLDADTMLLLLTFIHNGIVSYVRGDICYPVRKIPFKSIASTFEEIFVRSVLSEKGMEEYRQLKMKDNKKKNEQDK